MKNRFARFHNLPELMAMFHMIADIKTADMLDLPTPKLKTGGPQVIKTECTPEQKRLVMELGERAEKIRNGQVDSSEDNFLKLTLEARLLSTDPRAIDPDLPDDPNTKLNVCARKAAEIYHDYGYTADDLVLTGPLDAEKAVKNGLVCYALSPDGSKELIADRENYQERHYRGALFGMTADRYYPVGTHTVNVRAKDSYGGVSDWAAVTFSIANSAPTRPEITRTPGGNSVVPGTPVTITATSSDPDGDSITYVWEGRPSQTATYPLGKNTVRVKAVDSTGAESPWNVDTTFYNQGVIISNIL